MKKKSQAPQQPLPPSDEFSSSSDDDTSSQQLSPKTISKSPSSSGSVKAKPSSPPSESTEETNDESETSRSEDIVAPTPSPPSKKRKSSSSKAKGPEPEPEPEPEPKPKPKPKPSSTAAGSGRKIFQRLWTDEDELALAEGLAKYHEKHGKAPSTAAEYSVLVDDMKGRLHLDFSVSQFVTKVKHIKKKYNNHLVSNASAKENDNKCFSILKKIWEDEWKVKPTSSKQLKKKMKAIVDAQVAENQVVANEEETDEDVDILENVFDRQYVVAPFKRRLKKVLLSLDPKEKQHWTDMLAHHMKLLSKIESDFVQRLWDKQEEKKKT